MDRLHGSVYSFDLRNAAKGAGENGLLQPGISHRPAR